MKKVRLLRICFNDLGHGGIQSQFMNVTRLLKDKVDTDLIVWASEPGYYAEEFSKYGRIIKIPHYEGKNPIKRKLDFYTRYFRVKRAVYNCIKENGPYDAVHCHKFFECAPCVSAAHKAGVPVIISQSHNTGLEHKKKDFQYYLKQLYYRIYRKIIVKNSTHMIGCSQAAADYLFGKGVGRALYNGVDLCRFDADKYESDNHTGIKLLHVGKFCIQKNQLFLVELFAKLRKLRDDVSLAMIGGGEDYMTQVKKKADELGVGEYITYLPHDADVAREMANSDLFVFPSSFEGFGNVLIEAQAIGLKCFVSTEVTKEADCGLLTYIPLSDGADAWAEKINDYINERGTAKQKVDVSKFSSERMANELYDIYSGKTKR